jgi:hypothetical protein
MKNDDEVNDVIDEIKNAKEFENRTLLPSSSSITLKRKFTPSTVLSRNVVSHTLNFSSLKAKTVFMSDCEEEIKQYDDSGFFFCFMDIFFLDISNKIKVRCIKYPG